MKKIILLMALFCSFSFGQGWNNTLTPISESTLEKMDLFTNKDGNHLLIKRSNGNIVYYNFNSQGQVNTNKTVTLQTSGDFPTITGSNDIVYAIYKTGNYIRVKYSTNGGSSWLTSISDRSTTANLCNGIDAVYELGQGVHIVWATQDSDYDFETYYWRLTPPPYQWLENKNVTDYTQYEVGGAPTVTYSQGKVHVSYNLKACIQMSSVAKTRDRNGGIWQTPQFISTVDESMAEKLEVRGNYIYAVYGKLFIQFPNAYYHLAYKSRLLSGSWSSGEGTVIAYGILEDPTAFNLCKTYNDKFQLVYVEDADLLHRSFDGSWSDPPYPVDSDQSFPLISKGISSSSNDVFITWKLNEDNYIRYRQWDDFPLAPQNLQLKKAPPAPNYFVKVIWDANLEADLSLYEIWRKVVGTGCSTHDWQLIGTSTINSYIDYDYYWGGSCTLYYKTRAKDVGNHFSDFSAVVSGSGHIAPKLGENGEEEIIPDYFLSNNYPNPFNPTTTILFSVRSAGLVTLKIYDMLGKEVASLVNDNKEAGSYSVEFNAANLPSGIYVYKLTAGNFVDIKKLILLK